MTNTTDTWKRGVDFLRDPDLFNKLRDLYIDPGTHIYTCGFKRDQDLAILEENLKKYLKAKTLTSDEKECPEKMPDKGTIVAYTIQGEQMHAATIFVKFEKEKKAYTIVNLCMSRDNEPPKALLTAAWDVTNDYAMGSRTDNLQMKSLLEEISHREVDESEIAKEKEVLEELTDKYIPGSKGSNGECIFTFFYQEPQMSTAEIEAYEEKAEMENHDAYDDMNMKSDTMTWIRFTASEINYLQREIPALAQLDGKRIYDVGCSFGRHSIELAERCKTVNVIGIDYVDSMINAAEIERARMEYQDTVEFHACDVKKYVEEQLQSKEGDGDVVLCLYDVICSNKDQDKNNAIVNAVYRLCKLDGYAAFSVMNFVRSARGVYETMGQKEELRKIYKVPISKVMGTTGDVFVSKKYLDKYKNGLTLPPHALIDQTNQIIYRRERFDPPGKLPIVRIVCDRRYSVQSLKDTLVNAGFEVLSISPRCAGWRNKSLIEDGKELVAICHKLPKAL